MTITQDPETGRIIASHLSSEEGRELQARKDTKAEAQKMERAKKIVAEHYGTWEAAPARIQLAAEQWVHAKSGAGALYNKLIGELGNDRKRQGASWGGEEQCPTCKRYPDITLVS